MIQYSRNIKSSENRLLLFFVDRKCLFGNERRSEETKRRIIKY
ncbi:hypothetical protein [Metabacillus fastidiosus]